MKKTCVQCKMTLERIKFSVSAVNRDGFSGICVNCTNKLRGNTPTLFSKLKRWFKV